jgi:hypothetical protein
MRAVIFAIAAALLAGPALGQAAPAPETPPAAAAPQTAAPPAAAPPAATQDSEEFAIVGRSLGRSTDDREIEEVNLRSSAVVISPVRGRTAEVSDIVRAGLGELRAAMIAAGLTPSGRAMTVYLQITDAEFSAELMVPVGAPPASLPAGLRAGRSPEGRAIRILHPGGYDELNDTYEQLSTFIEDQDLQVRELVIERYLNDPDGTPPDELRTEVYVLLR